MKIFRKKIEESNKTALIKSKRLAATADFLSDLIVIFLVVIFIVRPFFIAPFQVRQESMMPNILDGEYILVWKLPYHKWLGWKEYDRNDVVVFRPSNDTENRFLIKRVIGLPGETLKSYQGDLWVKTSENEEFEKIDENFLSEDNLHNTCLLSKSCSDQEKSEEMILEVPEGSYLLLGDNRNRSRDARSCFSEKGCADDSERYLTHKEIEGKAIVVFARKWEENNKSHFSFSTVRIIHDPLAEETENSTQKTEG